MALTREEYSRMALLRERINNNTQTATEDQILEYLNLIQREGEKGRKEINLLMRRTQTNNINDLAQRLANRNNKSLLEGLLYAGLGMLIGWALLKALDE